MRYFTYLIAIFSGIAGLGYQITWSRMFAIGLGHEMPSVLAVITAFFAGLALGGWWLDRQIAISTRPARWYIGLELIIASWVLATVFLIPVANQICFALLGEQPGALRHWLIAFAVPLICLLPATVAMGATLPAMDRFAAPLIADQKVIGALYGANTLGAVLGTLLSAYWINPTFGYTKSLIFFAMLNISCAALVWLLFIRQNGLAPTRLPGASLESEPIAVKGTVINGAGTRIALIAFTTGLLGIGFEVVGIRALSSVFANTVYTYAAILAVFLTGTAIGGFVYQGLLRKQEAEPILRSLFQGLIVSIVLGTIAMANAHWFYFGLRDQTGNLPLAELVVAAIVFGLPTLLMGMFFSHLAQIARHAQGGVGRVLAINTIGSSLAPILFGIVMIPAVGVHGSLIVMILGYALVYLALIAREFQQLAWGLPLTVAAVAMVIGLGTPKLVLMKAGQRLVVEKPGIMASVAVVANANGKRGLRVSNHYIMGGTERPQFERMQGLLPILQHPAPEKALYLGIGTGITLGAATADPDLEVTGVELVPEIVQLLPYFEPENQGPSRHPRVRLVVADARRFTRASQEKFDVIVGDLYHPGRDGAGSLFTVEHFSAIRELLTEDGLACVWVPSYQTDTEVFKLILRSYLEVFPDAVAYCGLFDERLIAIALISDHRWLNSAETWFQQRQLANQLHTELESVDLPDAVSLLGHLVADNESLRTYAGTGLLNRDDWPAITYLAPKYVYQRYPRPSERFLDLNQIFQARRKEFLQKVPVPISERLNDYWLARDLYFEAMQLSHSDKTDALLRSLQASSEFPEAYREALKVARSLEADNLPKQAVTWLQKVIAERPQSEEAKILLDRLER